MGIKEKWASLWPEETHTTEYAIKRINSAKSAKLTPVKIDRDDMYGYFQGSHGRYETFLDQCPCGDFIRSKLPCKHIYRLAMELGAIEEDYKTDKNHIPSVTKDRIPLTEMLDNVERTSSEAQSILYDVVKDNSPLVNVPDNKYAAELLDLGILECLNKGIDLSKAKAGDLRDYLKTNNIDYKGRNKKSDLIEICMAEGYDRLKDAFPDCLVTEVRLSEKYSKQKLLWYLSRKDRIAYPQYGYNPDSGKFDLIVDEVFPDDDVTKELKTRGYLK